ncbi:hypothetical protein F4810DRAFT_719344 [Camillea tinctor]|nr:hypothetical protein F4810DRAFT_719344 [Camillea tinctor]
MASNRRSCDSSIVGDPLLRESREAENALEDTASQGTTDQQAKKRDLWAIAKEKVMQLIHDGGMLRSVAATPVNSPPATPITAAPTNKGKGKTDTPTTGSGAKGPAKVFFGPERPPALVVDSSDEEEDAKKPGSASKFWGKLKGKGKAKEEPEEPEEPPKPKQKDPLLQWFVDHSGGTMRDPPPPTY